jgi:hypothetical protein
MILACWGGWIRTTDYLIQSLVPAPAKPTNGIAAGRPTLADETVALPELSLEDRAVALASRGAQRIINLAHAAAHKSGRNATDDEFVAALEALVDNSATENRHMDG